MKFGPLDRDSSIPLYAQIEDTFRQLIQSGELSSGDRLPSENALTEMFGVSRMTLRGVLNSLVDDGFFYRVPGKGTYVAETKIAALSPAYQGIREQLEHMGYKIRTELVRMDTTLPSRTVRDGLGITHSVPVHEIVRRRFIDEAPVSIHRSFIPVHLAPELNTFDLLNDQLCVILEREYGLRAAKTHEQLEAVGATPEEAKFLGLKTASPLLLLEDQIYTDHNQAFEYSKILFRGDRMKLHFDYGHTK
ncbi:GntR family transcriptional regulator [Schaalia sp. ZJ405]|uniref:GntR family transcriptional regulator n=1 Tax=unclassified Schaalia TaxID=2691889 RepID=UPI0013EA80B3|nr:MULTISPECIES: GntR family transcriptional regulator [unclassified Schaalia]QPK81949.1 GntR family transcriptional regulator [Schaalia sp. ZJ405]